MSQQRNVQGVQGHRTHPQLLPHHAGLTEEGCHAVNQKSHQYRNAAIAARAGSQRNARPHDRPPRVSQALGCDRRRGRSRQPVAFQHDRKAEAARTAAGGGKVEVRRTVCYALFGRLRDRRRRPERRVGSPGAGIRFPAQPRRALHQGRVGARARHDRALASPALPDEARGRQVEEGLVGPGLFARSRTS